MIPSKDDYKGTLKMSIKNIERQMRKTVMSNRVSLNRLEQILNRRLRLLSKENGELIRQEILERHTSKKKVRLLQSDDRRVVAYCLNQMKFHPGLKDVAPLYQTKSKYQMLEGIFAYDGMVELEVRPFTIWKELEERTYNPDDPPSLRLNYHLRRLEKKGRKYELNISRNRGACMGFGERYVVTEVDIFDIDFENKEVRFMGCHSYDD
ncbi:MAG: hypothetical protein CMH63_00755 [Nanoarchaeota archaeon]|nr:hypothetical protein [Nanoarchaeota archaeon]